MPFDQFSTWQLAGDLMPAHTQRADARDGVPARRQAHDRERRASTRSIASSTRSIEPTPSARLPRDDGRLCALPRPQVRSDQPQGFLLAHRVLQQHRRAGLLCAWQHRHHRRADARWTDAATEAKLSAAAATVRAQRMPTRQRARRPAATSPTRAARAAQRTPERARSDACRQSLARGLVAYYPFEETAPIPDDKLPRSMPNNRRPAPPPLAPLTTAGATRMGRAPARRHARLSAPARSRSAPRPPSNAAHRRPQRAPCAASAGGPGPRRAACSRRARLPGVETGGSRIAASCDDGVKGKAFYLRRHQPRLPRRRTSADYERTQPFSLDLWVLAGAGVRGRDGPESSRERQLRQRRIPARSREESSPVRPACTRAPAT